MSYLGHDHYDNRKVVKDVSYLGHDHYDNRKVGKDVSYLGHDHYDNRRLRKMCHIWVMITMTTGGWERCVISGS